MANRPTLRAKKGGVKLTKERRKQRREARRAAKKALIERDVQKIQATSAAYAKADAKSSKHLEAAATRILHQDVRDKIRAAESKLKATGRWRYPPRTPIGRVCKPGWTLDGRINERAIRIAVTSRKERKNARGNIEEMNGIRQRIDRKRESLLALPKT